MRLLPLVAIAAIFFEVALLIYVNTVGGPEWGNLNLSGTLFEVLGIQSGWASINLNPAINGPTWYISVLLLCYLIFYLINKLSVKYNLNCKYLYLAMVFLGIGILSYKIDLPFLNANSARGYYSFFFGLLLVNYIKEKKDINKLAYLSISLILLTIFGIVYSNNVLNTPFDDYCWLTFAFFPSIIIISETKVVKKIFDWKILEFLSETSFNMYIWHVCGELIWKFILINHPILQTKTNWKMMILFLIINEICGILSYLFIEKPVSTITNKYLNNLTVNNRVVDR